MSLLKVNDLTKNFGGLTAVSNVSMDIQEGELIGLIGPNGAGKTTFFNLLTGVYQPSEGEIYFTVDGSEEKIDGEKTYNIAEKGIARTFQNIRLFGDLSVIDNVKIGMHTEKQAGLFSTFFRTPAFYRSEEEITEKAFHLLDIFDLTEVYDEKANNLPYGDQRKLEIVRAMATNPKLLFLDEPAAGMNPNESVELTQLIQRIHEEFNLTIILIEHDMNVVMNVCERIYVLEYGRLIAEGTPSEIQNNDEVIRAYLGGV